MIAIWYNIILLFCAFSPSLLWHYIVVSREKEKSAKKVSLGVKMMTAPTVLENKCSECMIVKAILANKSRDGPSSKNETIYKQ